jgi:hypothetical protein
MQPSVDISKFIVSFQHARFSAWHGLSPWDLTAQSSTVVRALFAGLSPSEYIITEEIAVHRSAIVESGSVLKGPLVVGAPGALLQRGSVVGRGSLLDQEALP